MNYRKKINWLVAIHILSTILILSTLSCKSKEDICVAQLRCEYRIDPYGIDIKQPMLSWEIESSQRDVVQTGYHLLVASSLDKLNANEGDLWDSQVNNSSSTCNLAYAGSPLLSRSECYWKVKVYTNIGTSAWSKPAKWTMAFLKPEDWQAKWIGIDKSFENDVLQGKTRLAARYLRKEFKADRKVKKATLYLSGLGLYEAYLNGNRIGDQVLSPTPTDYSKSIKYNTFDVTNFLTVGDNAMGIILGNGRFFSMRHDDKVSQPPIPEIQNFGFPKMILQLEIVYADGTSENIISDNSWKITADGPIRANNEYDGEEYDARKEMPGWDKTGYDDSEWMQVEYVEAPSGKLQAQINANIKIMQVIKPLSIRKLNEKTYILDMGQNMVGWIKMKVKGNSGERVTLRYAEALNEDGSIYLNNIRNALVTDNYTLKGIGTETWEPSFTYHGFRFVEITGYPGKATINDFEGKVIYDEMETTGYFETSDTTINQIYQNAYWGIRGNYRGMPTDCPQRDERMGWLGDRATGSHGESFIFDNHNLYAKWLDDIEDSQLDNGSIPDVAPAYWNFYSDNMTWPGAYLMIANMIYEQFGDIRPIIKHYPSMKRWIAYMKDHFLVDNIMTRDIYGDWCMPPESPEMIHSGAPERKTDGRLLGTAFYCEMLHLLKKFALLQQNTVDAEAFAKERDDIIVAYNRQFLNLETAQYSNNTVTANLISLRFNLVPEEYKNKVFANVVKKTMDDFDGHVSTGLIGIQWLMRGLTEFGREDLAYQIATNRDYPSWGYMIENGATTIWELWNGNTADPAMNSHNHVMLLGDLIIWFYEYLAGIQSDVSSNSFKEIKMYPRFVPGLSSVKASYHSVRGMIKSDWNIDGNTLKWDVSIPVNTKALLYFPTESHQNILEEGGKLSNTKGVHSLKKEQNFTIVEVGSGNYSFTMN